MPNVRSHLLSITLTPHTAELAEAKRAGTGVSVLRRSTLVFPAGVSLEDPAALGAALAEHIKLTGYGTKHAVIGLSARRVLARHRQVPPADRDAMRGIVNLQVEREFAGTAADMTFDYLLGEPAQADAQAPLLLAGVRSAVLAQARLAAQAAGLKIEAIAPTPFAAAAGQAGTVILIEPGVASVMRVHGGLVVGLASCSVDPAQLGDEAARSQLAADLSRCMLQLPGVEPGSGVTLLVSSAVDQASAQALTDTLAERFGRIETRQADAAELLAEHAITRGDALINFNDSRLKMIKRRQFSTTTMWAVRAAVLALLIGGTVAYLWFDATGRRDKLQGELDAIKDKAAELDKINAHAQRAKPWFDERTPAHDCLLELTRTFPKEGQIRVETLTINRDLSGEIECTAEDTRTMDQYFAQMRKSEALGFVDRGSVRPAGGNSKWINFPIAFRFNPNADRTQP